SGSGGCEGGAGGGDHGWRLRPDRWASCRDPRRPGRPRPPGRSHRRDRGGAPASLGDRLRRAARLSSENSAALLGSSGRRGARGGRPGVFFRGGVALPRGAGRGRPPGAGGGGRGPGAGRGGGRGGLAIYGRAGVGKTRLADECAGQAAASGHPTQRVAGSRTTALLPLGAVASLLPDGPGPLGPDGQVNAVALFEQTRQALHDRHRGHRLVTVADDMALLDAASLALLGYLAAQRAIFLIATVRTGEPVPDLLTDLWRDGWLERIDLHDLSRAHVDTLLHLALGGPIEAGAGQE